MSLTAAASTIFLMTNFLIALSLGTQRAQFVQRMYFTWPRPFLLRPLFLLLEVWKEKGFIIINQILKYSSKSYKCNPSVDQYLYKRKKNLGACIVIAPPQTEEQNKRYKFSVLFGHLKQLESMSAQTEIQSASNISFLKKHYKLINEMFSSKPK